MVNDLSCPPKHPTPTPSMHCYPEAVLYIFLVSCAKKSQALTASTSASLIRLECPVGELQEPCSCYEHSTNNINQPDKKSQESAPFLIHNKEQRFNVVLEEHPRHIVFGNRM